MPLLRPDLWEEVERWCKAVGYGKMFLKIEVDVDSGCPKQVAWERIRQTYRGSGKRRAEELIE